MAKITENEIELFATQLLKKQGYDYIYAPEYERNFEDVILKEKLVNALTAINPTLHVEHIEYTVKQIQASTGLSKRSVRAKLKVIVKRTLRQFGYPPGMQKLATQTVFKQAEMIANELVET